MQPSATTTRCLYNSLNIKMISGKNLAVQGQMNSSHSQDQCIYPRNNMFPSIKGAAGS